MSTFKAHIQKILTEAIDQPSAIHQSYEHQFRPSFVNYIKFNENGIKKGFDVKTNKWFVVDDPNLKTEMIAYGHQIKPGENFSKGITEDQAIQLLNSDLNFAREKVKHEIDSTYGIGLFNTLPLQRQEMLVDFMYNLGSLRSFPKFVRAVLINDQPTIAREYKRFSNGKEVTQRNQSFHDRYVAGL